MELFLGFQTVVISTATAEILGTRHREWEKGVCDNFATNQDLAFKSTGNKKNRRTSYLQICRRIACDNQNALLVYLKEQFHFQPWKVSHNRVSPDPGSSLHPKVKISFLKTGQKAAALVVAQELYFEGQVGTTLHLTGFSSSDYTVPCFLDYVIISF